MRRLTHTLLGATAALPLALSVEPGLALGCVWFGMVGGGFPDWFDLRSDLRKPLRLRHRGASHSILTGVIATGALFWALTILMAADFSIAAINLAPTQDAVWLWSASFALGFLSHLVGDACTTAGIRPLLPFSNARVWVLPRPFRSRSDGLGDRIGQTLALAAILSGVALYAARTLGTPL